MSFLNQSPIISRVIILSAAEIAAPTAAQLADYTAVYQLDVAPFTRYFSTGTILEASEITGSEVAALIAANDELGALAPAVQTLIDLASLDDRNRANHTDQDTMRVVTVSTNYTLLLADLRDPTIIVANSSAPITVFWPANTTTASKVGTPLEIIQFGLGAVTLAGASGVSVVSAAGTTTKGQYSSMTARKLLTNTIIVHSDVVASGGPVLITPPTIAGTGITGATMTLTPGTFNPDGTHSRQWRRVNLTTGAITNIGAGALTYVLVAGDEGSGVDCVETVTDTAGLSTSGVSNRITVTPAATKPVNVVAPFIVNGSSSITGGTVTVNAGTWTNSPTGYKFQRKNNGVNDGAVTDQVGATLAYTLLSTDEGDNISWNIIAYNGSGDAVVSADSPNWPVSGVAPQFTVNPQITYSATTDGSLMTCGSGTLNTTATLTRKWGFTDPVGPWTGFISPAQTGATYTALTDDIGSQLWCDVTASNAWGFVTIRALGPTITASVAAPPPPPPVTTTTRGPRVVSFVPSGNITAVSGQTISSKSFASSGICITVPQNVVGVTIEDCTFTTSGNCCILNQGTNTTIRYSNFSASPRGILIDSGTGTSIQYCNFDDFSTGTQFEGHAIQVNYSVGPTLIDDNSFTGDVTHQYQSDIVSLFQTSRVTLTNNDFDAYIQEPSGAPFTIGDTTTGTSPGTDNYIAYNTVNQSGGVPAGVFGSDGSTIIEYNCMPDGIQVRLYPPENPAPFVGVVVRKNVINIGVSFIPAVGLVTGWSTNVDSTNCALMPA